MAVDQRTCCNITEAADLLGVSRVSIWRWIRDGRLPVTRLGHRTTRIRIEDLQRFMADAAALSMDRRKPDPRSPLPAQGASHGMPHTGSAALSNREHMEGELPNHAKFMETASRLFERAGSGGRRVHIFGEMVALLAERGIPRPPSASKGCGTTSSRPPRPRSSAPIR